MNRNETRRATLAAAGAALAVATVAVVATALGDSPAESPAPAAAPTASPAAPDPEPAPSDPPVASPTFVGPVGVSAPGWACDPPADEKFSCTKDGTMVAINVRPARNHESYLDPAKADVVPGVHTFVSDLHCRFFATVAPVGEATQAAVDEVGAALVWAE